MTREDTEVRGISQEALHGLERSINVVKLDIIDKLSRTANKSCALPPGKSTRAEPTSG